MLNYIQRNDKFSLTYPKTSQSPDEFHPYVSSVVMYILLIYFYKKSMGKAEVSLLPCVFQDRQNGLFNAQVGGVNDDPAILT